MDHVDPLHQPGRPDTVWTTVNAAEAIPGVPTPLTASFWCYGTEVGLRRMFYALGVLNAAEREPPLEPDERFQTLFFGRAAANLSLFRRVAERIPGASADSFEEQYFGGVRTTPNGNRVPFRLPFIATRAPAAVALRSMRLGRLCDETCRWWQHQTGLPQDDEQQALDALNSALRVFADVHVLHSMTALILQRSFQELQRLTGSEQSVGLVASDGGMEETTMASDLLEVASGLRDRGDFLALHGFHGPLEGELLSQSWRENPGLLDGVLSSLASTTPGNAPLARAEAARRRRLDLERTILTSVTPRRRRVVRWLLKVVRRGMLDRELGKAAFLRAIDVGRCAARQLGRDLVRQGTVEEEDDVFFLTTDELSESAPDAEVIRWRRQKRAEYLSLPDLPEWWRGDVPAEHFQTDRPDPTGTVLRGLGVSPGVSVGRVRIVDDPSSADFLPDEILVCRTTDPSWAPLFVLATGVVTDVGGLLSHGAIVSRELGLPCIMNTRIATRWLRSGDLVRLDGTTGEVTRLDS